MLYKRYLQILTRKYIIICKSYQFTLFRFGNMAQKSITSYFVNYQKNIDDGFKTKSNFHDKANFNVKSEKKIKQEILLETENKTHDLKSELTSYSEDSPVKKTKKLKRKFDSESENEEKTDNTLNDLPIENISSVIDKVKVIKQSKKSSKKTKKLTHECKKPTENTLFKNVKWEDNEDTPYEVVALTFAEIEKESGRLKCIDLLSNLLKLVVEKSPGSLLATLYLCLNQLAPASEGLELGVGESLLYKALAQATGRSISNIKADAKSKGDLGIVAEASRNTQKTMFQPKKLTIKSVYMNLRQIAEMSGNSSSNKKIDKIRFLLTSAKDVEAKFVMRALTGKLRIGLAEQSVLHAIAITFDSDESQKGVDIIKTTYAECPSLDKIIPQLLKHGIWELPNFCIMEPGMPLKPMLAHPTKGVDDVLKRFDAKTGFACEYKYDGERAQIHLLEDGNVKIFSRNQEDNTLKYPDIVARIKAMSKVKSAILDSEAVAWDVENQKILPFQRLSTRKKKVDNETDIKVQVCVYLFDILYVDGESLVKKPLKERRQRLAESFMVSTGQLVFATGEDAHDAESVAVLLEKAVKDSCEGLMLKALDDTYEIAKRSHSWLKLKKDYIDSAGGDTLDLIVIGAYDGSGKRTGRFGGFLLACYNSDNEDYQTICKIGTGFSDDELEKFTNLLKPLMIEKPRAYYSYKMTPDHWVDGKIVWEVKAADLSISPAHTAAIGLVSEDKGISLRFPRFVRVRDDKKAEDATNCHQVVSMYKNQEQVQSLKANNMEPDDY